jgi:hypothetical protein
MQKTLIVIVTHRTICQETSDSVAALQCPSVLIVRGIPDQSKARSLAFDKALEATAVGKATCIDTILALDDDMVFGSQVIQSLVDHSRETQHCCSTVAVNAEGKLCARPLPQLVLVPGNPTLWLTGLACMAIPRTRMARIQERLPVTAGIHEWCRSGAHPDYPDEWLPNDFWFCQLWQGVLLLPLAVGHMKPTAIWPDERMVREVCHYRPKA